MRPIFVFKKRGLIFLSLVFSFLISQVLASSLFLNETPLYSFSKIEKSIVGFKSRLNNTVDTFLAGITVEKTVTDKALTNSLSTIDFAVISPTIDIVFPTESLFLRPTAVQPSVKPSKIPVVNKVRPTPTSIQLSRPSATKIPSPTKVPPRPPSPTSPLPPPPTTIPTLKVVNYPDPLGLPPPSSKIHDLAVEIGQKVGVPPALILTFMYIETGGTFYSRDNAYVEQYSKPGASMKNLWGECKINSCGAAGPMQMTVGYDSYGDTTCSQCPYTKKNYIEKGKKPVCPANAWNGVVGQVRSLVGSSSVSPCNIRENMYGAAIKIKRDSTVYVGAGIDCTWPHPDIYKMQPVVNGIKWNIKAVYLSGCHYYGDCVTKNPNSGNKNYCQYLWDSLPPEHKIL